MKNNLLYKKLRNSIAQSIYIKENLKGFQGYDDAAEKCFKICEEHIKKEIEKCKKIKA